MNDAIKPHAMFGILFGLLVSIQLWCCAAILMTALT
jgi:hypothetical protein